MKRSLDYLAGLFDGEGSFSIQFLLRGKSRTKPHVCFNPAMTVELYYGAEVLEAFVSAFGGQIYTRQRNERERAARWHLGGVGPLKKATRTLIPRLVIKHAIAKRFVSALEYFPLSRKGINTSGGDRIWATENALAVAEIALSLNPPRSRRTHKPKDYTKFLRKQLSL